MKKTRDEIAFEKLITAGSGGATLWQFGTIDFKSAVQNLRKKHTITMEMIDDPQGMNRRIGRYVLTRMNVPHKVSFPKTGGNKYVIKILNEILKKLETEKRMGYIAAMNQQEKLENDAYKKGIKDAEEIVKLQLEQAEK